LAGLGVLKATMGDQNAGRRVGYADEIDDSPQPQMNAEPVLLGHVGDRIQLRFERSPVAVLEQAPHDGTMAVTAFAPAQDGFALRHDRIAKPCGQPESTTANSLESSAERIDRRTRACDTV
jgi:hypothetical protein